MPSDKMSHLLLRNEDEQSATLPEAPPAPPPIQPVSGQQNPYDFITNPGAAPKKSLLPGGSSKTGRLLLLGAGAVILIMLIVIVFGLLNSGSAGIKSDYQAIVNQQAELIRVSGIGVTKARQAEAKNLAITTQYTLTSQQAEIAQLAQKAGANTDAKVLALSKDAKTDNALETAEQANTFDAVFVQTLTVGLKKYQQALKKAYDASSNSTTKDKLSQSYNAVDTLLGTKTEE